MGKFYTVDKEINGVKYTAQFNGISAALEAADKCYVDGTGNTSALKMAKYLLDHVIVEPHGLSPDDFDSIDDLSAVTTFANEVMHGKFRDAVAEGAAAKKGTK